MSSTVDHGSDADRAGGIWLLGECRPGKAVEPEVGELLAFAQRLTAAAGPRPVSLLLLGETADSEAAAVVKVWGVETVAMATPPGGARGEAGARLLADFLEPRRPAYVCCRHSSWSFDLQPALAVFLAAAAIAGVQDLQVRDGELFFGRPTAGGRQTAWIRSRTPVAVISLQPGSCPPAGENKGRP
ncbi:MAG: hypothetical protein JRJ56_06540, partial [Deltaproteobacteria bacterium]|nr:hypothetical protein [Deltaproteobacteria bacterium]